MALKIWTAPGTPVADLTESAQVLALGFLERAVAAIKKEVQPIVEGTYWRPAYEEASVMEDVGRPAPKAAPPERSLPRDNPTIRASAR